jgi:hypothetical protein
MGINAMAPQLAHTTHSLTVMAGRASTRVSGVQTTHSLTVMAGRVPAMTVRAHAVHLTTAMESHP